MSLAVGPLLTNCYILAGGDREALIIDPGADADQILACVQQEGLRIQYLVATHAHFDHVGAMRALQETGGGETLMHRADLPLLQNLAAQGASFGIRVGPAPRIDRFLEEGEVLPLGGGDSSFRVLHTPGHSPGGISLLGEGMVFVGDTLFAASIGRTDLPGSSHPLLLRSIREKLFSLEDGVLVFPGHGEVTTIGREREGNPFLREEEE
ncbi:MAG: MBL fold metallo-hydrolase [candidate division NC10 bacterium]|nr:MBL fold metallo-hydrolase [candidate division NC10 bacterium]